MLFSAFPESILLNLFCGFQKKIEQQIESQGKREKIIFCPSKRESFTIEWGDGTIDHFRAGSAEDLPLCAVPRKREKRVVREYDDSKNNAGWAIWDKILFQNGCSQGIYPFVLLKEVMNVYD